MTKEPEQIISGVDSLLNEDTVRHRYSMEELFPIFMNVDRQDGPMKLSPSAYNYELQLSMEERLQRLGNVQRKCDILQENQTRPSLYYILSPRIMIFQNFTPGYMYNGMLNIQNAHHTPRPLDMNCEESRMFCVMSASERVTKIAQGLSATFVVQFTPDEDIDYIYNIHFTSEEESFDVPVIAIARRPMLDFPDEIIIPAGSRKGDHSTQAVAQNISEIPAVFTIFYNSPFAVNPSNGVVNPGASLSINVSVHARNGEYIEDIIRIKYETGEEVFTKVCTTTENVDIRLDPDTIHFDGTNIGLKECSRLFIHNNSGFHVPFKWTKISSNEEKIVEMEKLKCAFSIIHELEARKSVKLDELNIIDPESHENVCSRIYDDEVKTLESEEFLYNDNNFTLVPTSGDLWPNIPNEIKIFFEPDAARLFNSTAYCELLCCEKRLALTISGYGLGPQIALNLASLDTHEICLQTIHYYEVVAKNIGIIPGTLNHILTDESYGVTITCTPCSREIMPGSCETFVIEFLSTVQGTFREQIEFCIEESNKKLKLLLTGKMVSPTLKFDMKTLDIGTIPFGFPHIYEVTLNNLSTVPIHYWLYMESDGKEPGFSYKTFAALKVKPALSKNPRQFIIEPDEGILQSYGKQQIKLTVVPNLLHSRAVSLAAKIMGFDSNPILLPITFTVKCPEIECAPNNINIRFCFVNYPYTRNLVLENQSTISGFYYIIPQQVASTTTMTFSTPVNQGVLKPKGKMKIPLSIMTCSLGMQSLNISCSRAVNNEVDSFIDEKCLIL